MRYGRRKKGRYVFGAVCAVMLAATGFLLLDAAVRPQVRNAAVIQAQSYAALTAGKNIPQILRDTHTDYGGLVQVTRDEKGSIVSVQTDVTALNILKSQINSSVCAAFAGFNPGETGIPLGNLTGLALLNGRGPQIKTIVSITGSARTDFEDSFESTGINQVRHRIYLKTTVNMLLIVAGESLTASYTYTHLVAETVFAGETPGFFAGITQK